jgi:hypothetical protein
VTHVVQHLAEGLGDDRDGCLEDELAQRETGHRD